MLIQLSLLIFFAQSGAEWKIVRSTEWGKRNFHGGRGMFISGAISAALSLLALNVSPTFAGAFAIAGLFGIFTNELTFAFYEAIWQAWQHAKNIGHFWTEFKLRFGKYFNDFVLGAKGVIAFVFFCFVALGKFIRFVGWALTLPQRAATRIREIKSAHIS